MHEFVNIVLCRRRFDLVFGNPPRELPQRIGFVLIDRFSMIAFTSAIEPLRIANRLSGRDLYDWSLYSVEGEAVQSSCRIEVHPNGSIDEADKVMSELRDSWAEMLTQNPDVDTSSSQPGSISLQA